MMLRFWIALPTKERDNLTNGIAAETVLMKNLTGLFGLLRFELPLSAGICVVMGQMLALGEFASLPTTLFGFCAVFFISASILVLNDVMDVETDRVNAPQRPIPAGLVSLPQALIFSVVLLIAGLGFSLASGFPVFVIAVVLALVGFLYNRYFKKSGLPGNLMVSFSVGMTFVFGGATVGMPFNKMVLFFALIAALVDLAEEIAADAMDMKGDMLIQSNSLAIRRGAPAAIRVSVGLFFLVVLLSLIPFMLGWFGLIYLIPIGIMDIAIAWPALRLLRAKDEEGRVLIRYIYLGATFGLVVFLIMRMSGV